MTSMREMQRQKAARKAGTPEGKRNPKIISPYQQRAKAKAWNDDQQAEPELVVNAPDLAAFEHMCTVPYAKDTSPAVVAVRDQIARRHGMRPLKPPPVVIPERNDAARVAAARDRNGVA